MDFRPRLLAIASEIGPPSLFRRESCTLSDFLDNVVQPGDDAHEIGAKVIDYFCLDNRSFNGCMPGIRLAVAFLDLVADRPSELSRDQCLKDLKVIVARDCDFLKLLQWVRANYR